MRATIRIPRTVVRGPIGSQAFVLRKERPVTGEVYFISEWHDDEAELIEPKYLNEEGLVPDQWHHMRFWVDRARVYAAHDGVFVRKEKIDGENYYRQCPPPETAL